VDARYAFAATVVAAPSHLFEAAHEAVIADPAVFVAMLLHNPRPSATARRFETALATGIWTA